MLRYLITADWQCQVGNLTECERIVARIETLLKEAKQDKFAYDGVLHLGDVKEDFNPVDQRVSNFLTDATRRVCDLTQMYVVAGNHDRTSMSDESPSCLPMLETAGAKIFDEAGSFGAFRVVPYSRNEKKFKKEVQVQIPGNRILLFHGDVKGAELHAHRKSPSGLEITDYVHWTLAIGGHLHKPQQLGMVWYVGSPFPQDWGECNQQKRFLDLTFEGRTILTGGKPVLESIDTGAELWYDPELPDFVKPTSCKVKRVRIHLRGDDATVAEQRCAAEKRYAGANLVWVRERPEQEIIQISSRLQNSTQLLKDYVDGNPPTDAESVEQVVAFLTNRLGQIGSAGVPEITLGCARAKNVLSFQDEIALQMQQGLTLVTGENGDWPGRSNGSGKTNLLGLPMVALFGVTNKGQKHDKWIGRGKGKAWVSLSFKSGANTVMVTRMRRPGALEVLVDGKVVLGDANEIQRKLNAVLGLTASAFCNSIYIGQQEIATILTGTDSERKELLSRFLSLDVYLKTSENIRKEINALVRRTDAVVAQMEAHSARVEELEQQLKGLTKQREVAAIWGEIVSCKRQVETLERNRITEDEELSRWHKAGVELQKLWREAGREEGAISGALQAANRQHALLSKGKCGVCGQEIPAVNVKQSEKQLAQLKEQQVAAASRLVMLAKSVDRNEETRNALQQALAKMVSSINELKIQIQRLENEQVAAEHMAKLQSRVVEQQRLVKVHSAYIGYLHNLKLLYEYCASATGRNGIPLMVCRQACTALNASAQRYATLFGDGEIGVRFAVDADGSLDVHVDNPNGGDTLEDQSMGESRTAALIATFALRGLFRSNVMILDEPGEGLDSVGAHKLGKALGQLKDEIGSIYVVTHNPHIVAGLEPDHCLCVVKENGVSTVREGVANVQSQ